jgi:hypothetical protein
MIKKLSIFLMSVLAFGLVACDSYDDPTPQAYAQEAMYSFDGLTVAKGSDLTDAIDLIADSLKDSLNVIKTVATPDLSGGQSVQYVMYVAKDSTYANQVAIPVSSTGNISKVALNAAFRSLIGNTPKAQPVYYRFAAYIADGTSWVKIGGSKSVYYGAGVTSVTPLSNGIVVESAYYLIGSVNSWSMDNLMKFNHSSQDVYTDPVFTILIKTDADSYWKVIPQSNVDSGKGWDGEIWGVAKDGDISTSGSLINVSPNAARIPDAGYYMLSINMMERTYTVTPVNLGESLYVIGGVNGWDITASAFKLTHTTGTSFEGEITFPEGDNYFRFYSALGDWGTGSIGSSTDSNHNETLSFDSDGLATSTPVMGGQGCWIIPGGKYDITVDLGGNTITFVKE